MFAAGFIVGVLATAILYTIIRTVIDEGNDTGKND